MYEEGVCLPGSFSATAQKGLALDCRNFVTFTVSPHHLVYFLVSRDLSCCHGNPVSNTCLVKGPFSIYGTGKIVYGT